MRTHVAGHPESRSLYRVPGVMPASGRCVVAGGLAALLGCSDVRSPEPALFDPIRPDLFGDGGALTDAWADIDLDGDPDRFVGFNGTPSRLYRNDLLDAFTDISADVGLVLSRSVRTSAWGDFDGDGEVEYVIATHDAGVVAVFNPGKDGGEPEVIEMDQKVDTFVHEIEIGDIDGDGTMEFFATPTDRNTANASQGGMMVMYRWNGSSYERSVVDPMGDTHAKEILAADLDGDGKSELFSVLEAETDDQQAGYRTAAKCDVQRRVDSGPGGFSGSHVGSYRYKHADVARQR